MRIKDKKASVIFFLLTGILWQLMISFGKILKNPIFNAPNPLFSIQETTNKGAAFGIFKDNPYFLGVLGVIVLLILCFWVVKYLEFKDKSKILLSSMCAAGILGNTTERLINGYVLDFIKLGFLNFPVFNLFDCLISISVLVFIVLFIKDEILKGVKKVDSKRR